MRSTAHPTAYVTTARPRYGVGDVIGLLFRDIWLMIVVFLAVFALGVAGVIVLSKKTYTAYSSIYAGVSDEYVYQPRTGAGQSGQAPDGDQVSQAEANILGSLEVKRRTVEALGPDVILGRPGAGDRTAAAIRALDAGLKVQPVAGSPIITTSYEADDPARAARILNTVVAQYLLQRRQVFQDRTSPAIAAQRQAFEGELANADQAYEAFLQSNDIGDFATAKATTAATYQSVFTESLSVKAQLNQASQRLATLEAQLARQPAEVVLQQDLNVSAQDQILQLRTQREALLSRYTPDAQPVKDIDQQIADLQAYVATGTTVGPKEVRTGPSAIYTEIETTRINAAAERDALAARLGVLNGQLAHLREQQARLTQLESPNATLAGNRDVLTASIKDFQQRETQARADNALVKAGADNVRVVSQAEPPSQGKSLKIPLLAAAFLFAGFTALCVGLLRVFTRRGYTTPASTGRTLEMPVLAVARMKAR